jgi:cytochrome P450
MIYLDCVIKEVLRFCPSADGDLSTLTADDRLSESDFQLYKGDSVFILFHNLAYDTRYWSFNSE